MSVILVYAEQRGNVFRKPALESLTQGRCLADKLGADLAVLIAGSNIGDLATEAGTYGADQVYTADRSECSPYHTEVHTALLVDLIDQLDPRLILMGHTAVGKDLAPRVAEKANAGFVSDCIDISVTDGDMTYTRPIYAGKAFARLSIETPLHVVTLRPNIFPIKEKPGSGKMLECNVTIPEPRARVESVELTNNTRPELTEAEVIVSGGRGLGEQNGFELLGQLADLMGAALGASRTAVDSGWIPPEEDGIGPEGQRALLPPGDKGQACLSDVVGELYPVPGEGVHQAP